MDRINQLEYKSAFYTNDIFSESKRRTKTRVFVLGIRLTAQEHALLLQRATNENISSSEIARKALIEYCWRS